MPSYECVCGAKYRFSDAQVGKKAKCKKCGVVFTLAGESDPIPIAAEPDFAGEIDTTLPRQRKFEQPSATSIPVDPAPVGQRTPTHAKGYGDSLLWTILFPSSPRNLLTFFVVWFIVGGLGILPFVGLIVSLWYAGFRFAVISAASNGEEDIPSFSIDGDIMGNLILPAFRWFGSWLLAMMPAVALAVVRARTGAYTGGEVAEALSGGLAGMLDLFALDPLFVVLFVLGLCLWPMIVLCIAVGDWGAAFRPDLMLVTVIRSFPAYAVTLVFVGGSTIAAYYLRAAVVSGMTTGVGASAMQMFGSGMLVLFLVAGVEVYFDIVMLRAIGLYYHHFKHKFAWNWG